MNKIFTITLFFCLPFIARAQYLENFTGQNGKGLVNAICPNGSTDVSNCGCSCTTNGSNSTSTCTVVPPDFTGVDWTIITGPSNSYFTNPSGFGFESSFATNDFGVVGERMQVNDPDEEICWLSPELDISTAGAVSIAIDVSQSGGLESSDYIRGDYSLDGGSFVAFETQSGAFSATQLNTSGLTGTTLTIRVCADNNSTAEFIYFDNVSVPQSGVTTGGCVSPVIGIVTTQAGSCNNANGTVQVTATGGSPGYDVAWSGPSSGNPAGTEIAASGGSYTISPLTPGTYSITVTDANTCTATTTATITVATAMSPSAFVLPATCTGVSDGEIDLTVSNGVPPFSYSWSNLPGSPDPEDQSGLGTGTYTVTATDAAGCTATTSATVGAAVSGAYLETFSLANKGYKTNFEDDFVGVNWTLSSWTVGGFGRDGTDYFSTSGGVLNALDVDEEVCWISPVIDINPPGSGIGFSVDLSWVGFDNTADYIDVKYSLDGGGYTTVSNAAGGWAAHTIGFISGPSHTGSTTVSVNSLSGNSIQIQVCGDFNADTESMTIDNVSVPGANGLSCPCPTISFTATPTNTCSGSSNGQIAVTGVTGGTGPYMYSKDNGANFQSGATFTGLAAGMYDIVVKDANGCESAASQVTVGTFSAPACAVTGPDFVCNNTENIVYSAPGGMSAYSWGISGNGSIPGSTTGSSVSVTSGNYLNDYTVTVTVTDGNGCTSSCTKQSSIYLAKPPADITANPNPVCLGAILDLSISAAASSTVSWTGEGITNPSGNPSTTAVPTTTGPHVYSVMVTTNPAGCTNTGTVNVTVLSSPTVFNITGGGSYCSGGPGVEIGLSGSEIGAEYALFLDGGFLFSLSGTGSPLSFGLQTAAGTYQALAITNTICQDAMSGTVSVTVQSCEVEFSGKIVWEDDDVSGVKDATVNVTGSDTGSDLTDINGDYSVVTTVTTGNFTLKPVKNINKFNGVTAGDATAIQQHVTLINPITDPYKQVCADVNKSNSISTLDASLVVQALLGNPTANAIFNTSWRFVPLSWALSVPPWGFPEQLTYTGISGPQTDQDFIGMKIGDVTGDANPANFGAGESLNLIAQDQILSPDAEFDVDISAGQLDDLIAFQFALDLDPAYLELVSVEPIAGGLPLTTDDIGLYNQAQGEVRVVVAKTEGFPVAEAAPAMRLHLKARQGGVRLSEVMQLDDSVLPGLSYNSTLEESKVGLTFLETTGINPGDPRAAGLQLQNRPNPFNQTTTVSFVLPEATEAQLRIYDASGRLVWERNKAYPAGYSEEAVQFDGVSGVLNYELVTPFGTVTKRMVRVGN